MKPPLKDLMDACGNQVAEGLVSQHYQRLDAPYYNSFSLAEIAAHVRGLSNVTSTTPVQLLVETSADHLVCTLLAFDYPAEFALICGVFSALGFTIHQGDAFTYGPAQATSRRPRHEQRHRSRVPTVDPMRRRRVVDRFSGKLLEARELDEWTAEAAEQFAKVFRLLESGEQGRVTARTHVNDLVARSLNMAANSDRALYHVDVDVDNSCDRVTWLHIYSQDTPAFLYALSNALVLHGLIIDAVRIRTEEGCVRDDIAVVDARHNKITDRPRLARLRVAALLTKHFTYFIGHAPDPFSALGRFDDLVTRVFSGEGGADWMRVLTDPKALQDLARLLGASDFLWEDFVRLQYATLLPMLGAAAGRQHGGFSPEELKQELDARLVGVEGFAARRHVVNDFKDQCSFQMDVEHILQHASDVRTLAIPLTRLGELVVETALQECWDAQVKQHGVPRTTGGMGARMAVLGLGKLGGEALGYASDIELMFVFSDNGHTDGANAIENAEFFDRVAFEAGRYIESRREGIFRVDLRLRPHGNSGPRACSLETFCRYYAPEGEAAWFERLALTRLRRVAGDEALGCQIERLRDQLLYTGATASVTELLELRQRQHAEKTRPGRLNAKYSTGALVDVEYSVQMLQVAHAGQHASLRTPRIHEALDALSACGVLDAEESRQLAQAYYFFRKIINGVRMLRGNALDLELPEEGALEYAHLARRVGYLQHEGLDAASQLRADFAVHSAVVKAFVERHFGSRAVIGGRDGTLADLIMAADPDAERAANVLRAAHFCNPVRALDNLRRLAGTGAQRDLFCRLALLSLDMLAHCFDPDMALDNWERFSRAVPDTQALYRLLLWQPRRLEILLDVLSGSQFLSDTLCRNPEFLDWALDPAVLQTPRRHERLAKDLEAFCAGCADYDAWLGALRRFRRRELLRIGTRDMCLRDSVERVTKELSALADVLLEAALTREWEEWKLTHDRRRAGLADHFCILAMGKLGGQELNYSSDIDLFGVYSMEAESRWPSEAPTAFAQVLERVRAALSAHTGEGYVYRVDFRLRPYGRAGALVHSQRTVQAYYMRHAALWEQQALLKARPVAGALDVGQMLLWELSSMLCAGHDPKAVIDGIVHMRSQAERRAARYGARDVKSGVGGIRDIEFLVQGLQMIHVARHPQLLGGHTLRAIALLRTCGIITGSDEKLLFDAYTLLRRIEHYLQLLEDRQTHTIPDDGDRLKALARRTGGKDMSVEAFRQLVTRTQQQTRNAYQRLLVEATQQQDG